ncbi:PHD finger domain-containing protein [Diaporthe helianthi]|uniref:PHD finger domain-containing protein n=1 Tax=Diaporthe helianthi TaxID=158607 RepID=A0A2P5I1K1_DIAHE|nr:PHD finger domain-containing protein [Diaporthe helianthi]
MASRPSTPRSSRSGRVAGRGRAGPPHDQEEPPLKKRKYVPGGPGGGGRFVLDDGLTESPAGPSTTSTPPRPRSTARRTTNRNTTVLPRERSARLGAAASRSGQGGVEFSSAAAVAAAVAQSEGYKPREERGWEEFHPNLDIEGTFIMFHAEDVDGTRKSTPPTLPTRASVNGAGTPSKDAEPANPGAAGDSAAQPDGITASSHGPETPSRRRPRPARDAVSFYATRSDFALTPKTPKVLSTLNQTPKERLDLKNPSYRKTNRILLFESKTFGQAKYVEKAMMNVGYQESDNFIRPERGLLKASDAHVDEDVDQLLGQRPDGEVVVSHSGSNLGRVEYDMDEQDDMWLETLNSQRKANGLELVTREVFEITITKIEKEWHALEKKIPKPNPKPPQTHRPRSSSAAAVNGETQPGEEQDSKCAICDDGDCENTNAIVFCDGCDLAVHQDCYGVPFIPEGQWMCRKCQLAGRGIPTCIFCPNTDGAFKQTNFSKWAHLLCAIWIPEVNLGNNVFLEPVMDVDKVPKNRWKLQCYICNQKMGACIQCSNKACYQAFHVTCARRARLYLKMKTPQGALALDGVLKAFCDKHCPPDYDKEHAVAAATKDAKKFYKRTMKGRIWADSQAVAQELAAIHRNAITEQPPQESQLLGDKLAGAGDKKKGEAGKIWKLPSGAPVIPQAVFDLVDSGLARFSLRKRKEYIAEACRYWTLKRESRRGAALLKRLQLQMESFSSMELTRRDFAAMGPSGKNRLARRIEFAETLLRDLEQLKSLADDVVSREAYKLEAAEMEQDFVDSCYFPISKLLVPVIGRAEVLDKNVFKDGLLQLEAKFEKRFYTTTLAFAHDLCEVIHVGINAETKAPVSDQPRFEPIDVSPTKHSSYSEAKDRKRLGKRILKSVQPQLEAALKAEADITSKPFDSLQQELEGMIDASLEIRKDFGSQPQPEVTAQSSQDVIMVDAAEGPITVAVASQDLAGEAAESDDRMDIDEQSIEVKEEETAQANGGIDEEAIPIGDGDAGDNDKGLPSLVKSAPTPPETNGYVPVSQHSQQLTPLTPPQSNGSLGRGADTTLTEGGVPWYLKNFELDGTTAIEEQWAGRDAVRSLSEELTDMDEEELNDLEFNVEDSTITASPVEAPLAVPSGSSARKLRYGSSTGVGNPRKRLRSSGRRR